MNVMFAAFQSRRDAIAYARSLARMRVRVRVVATPSGIGSGCGLSVKFPRSAFPVAEGILSMGEYGSFLGFYRG